MMTRKTGKLWAKLFGKEGSAMLYDFSKEELERLEQLLEYYGLGFDCEVDKENSEIRVWVNEKNANKVITIWLLIGAARQRTLRRAIREVDEQLDRK